MKLYSTKNNQIRVNLREAVLNAMPQDGGLYMPTEIAPLPSGFYDSFDDVTFTDLALKIASHLIGDEVPERVLKNIIDESITFPAPVVQLDKSISVLELWHGPTLAFKDFGARFMAQLIGYFNKSDQRKYTVLVATSGDTGGAVASGFLGVDGVEVIILYPKGKVSFLQEQQLTTLGNNITALEIDGTFDDCQSLVKQAFLDGQLSDYNFISANSINIGRLIPQCFYYFEAMRQVGLNHKVVFSVPSGNFGNLTAGIIATKLGLPIHRFIASTNANDIVPHYLKTGDYAPRPSVETLSNAMDVGNPSNFVRIQQLFGSTWNDVVQSISGFSADDEATLDYMKECYQRYNYICDPHGAIAYGSLKGLRNDEVGVFLETAHPSKFMDTVESALSINCPIPDRLERIKNLKSNKVSLDKHYPTFTSFLKERNN